AERDSPGIREGTLGVGVGSLVYCLGHPDLGTGTVAGVNGLQARVWFEPGELALPQAEIQLAEPVPPDEPRAAPGAGGSPGEHPFDRAAPRAPRIFPNTAVVCPSRPELGRGFLLSLHRVFTVRYDSGLRTQTDEEIRPAPPVTP